VAQLCFEAVPSERALAETCAVEAGFDAAPSLHAATEAKNPATTGGAEHDDDRESVLRAISNLLVVLMSGFDRRRCRASSGPGEGKAW
jgi:hypothetical protein